MISTRQRFAGKAESSSCQQTLHMSTPQQHAKHTPDAALMHETRCLLLLACRCCRAVSSRHWHWSLAGMWAHQHHLSVVHAYIVASAAWYDQRAAHLSLCMRSRRGLACPSCKALSNTVACFCRAPPVLSVSYKTVDAVATMCCSLLPSCIQHKAVVCEHR